MRKLILGCCLFVMGNSIPLLAQKGSSQKVVPAKLSRVYVKGRFISKQKELQLEDMSEFQYLKPKDTRNQVAIDSVGGFSLEAVIRGAGYFRIGRNILYLSPNDQLEMVIDHQDPSRSTFKGRSETINRYLKDTPFPKGGSYLEGGKLIAASPLATLRAIQAKAKERSTILASLKGVAPLFIQLEMGRIDADVVNSIQSVRYYAARKLKLSKDSASIYLKEFYALADPVTATHLAKLKDERLLQLVVYRDIVPLVLANVKDKKQMSRTRDWLLADSLVRVMTSLDSKPKIVAFEKQLVAIKSADYRSAATEMNKSLQLYGKGDIAADFVARDAQGNTVRLSDLKGKLIYIDLWATWCGPCLAEMPAFEKLRKAYAADDRVVFVSVSIDADTAKWKQNLLARKASGLQWHIPQSALKDYQVLNIPRTIIISPDFRIADFQAPLPSAPETKTMLDKLLFFQKSNSGFKVEGKLDKAPMGSSLYLTYKNGDRLLRDSVRLVDGSFRFSGPLNGVTQASLLLTQGVYAVKKNSDQTTLYLGEAPVIIKGIDSIATASIEGGRNNLANQELKAKIRPLEKGRLAILYALNQGERPKKEVVDSLKLLNGKLLDKMRSEQREFVKKYNDLTVGLEVLKAYAGPIITVAEIGPLYDQLSPLVRQTSEGTAFGKAIVAIKGVAVGQQAPSFSLPDANGKFVSLNSFKGKYVLLDFWASWCVPCRAENPNLVKAHQKYKNRGFTVIGVSMDVEKAKNAWLDAIKKDGLDWTNVSDLKGFDGEVAKSYQIKAIPQNFLIGPDGKILAKDLKWEGLFSKLAELFH